MNEVEEKTETVFVIKDSRLWNDRDAERWVYHLKHALKEKNEFGKKEIRSELFGSNEYQSRNRARDVFGYKTGLENGTKRIEINGIGMFRKKDNARFKLSSPWEHIVKTYSSNPSDDKWRTLICDELAKYHIRTRLFLYIMLHYNITLKFDKDVSSFRKWTGKNGISKANFTGNIPNSDRCDIERFFTYSKSRDTPLNQLLVKHADVVIGPDIIHRIFERTGVEVSAPFKIRGPRGERYPYCGEEVIGALKYATILFRRANLLKKISGDGRRWKFDVRACRENLSCIDDFSPDVPDFMTALKEALKNPNNQTSDGYFVKKVRRRVCDRLGIKNNCVQFFKARVQEEDNIKVSHLIKGSRKQGPGIYGDPIEGCFARIVIRE